MDVERISAENETRKHIANVQRVMSLAIGELIGRSIEHDKSKFSDTEMDVLVKYTPKLKNTTYGSEEYKQHLKEMAPMILHHQANNAHHPEHHLAGLVGMTLMDLLEMVCDWKAATLRHDDGNVWESLEINARRFGIGGQLLAVLVQTVLKLEKMGA
jgi:hypothetical protein